MADRADLVSQLRAVDEALAEVRPSAGIQARIRARVHQEEARRSRPSAFAWIRVVCERGWRPLLFAGAATAAIVLAIPGDAPHERTTDDVAERLEAPDASPEEAPRPEERPAQDEPRRSVAPRAPEIDAPAPRSPAIAPREAPRSLDSASPEQEPLSPDRAGPWGALDRAVGPSLPSRDVTSPKLIFGGAPIEAPAPVGTAAASAPGANAGAPRGRAATEAPVSRSSGEAQPPSSSDADLPSGCRDEETLFEEASYDCKKQGLPLFPGDFKPTDPCGSGMFRSSVYDCSDPSERAECAPIDVDFGHCVDPIEAKKLAEVTCGNSGYATLEDAVFYARSCGALARAATVTCCDPIEQSPGSTPSCVERSVGDGVRCRGLEDWKIDAATVCESEGFSAFDFKVDQGECGPSAGSSAYVVCCEG